MPSMLFKTTVILIGCCEAASQWVRLQTLTYSMWGQQQWTCAPPECIHNKWSWTVDSELRLLCSSALTKRCVWRWHVPASAPSPCAPSPPSLPWCLSGPAPHSAPTLTGTKTTSSVTTALRWMRRKKRKANVKATRGDVYLVSSLSASCSPPPPPQAFLSKTWKDCLVNTPLTHAVKCSDLEIISGPGNETCFVH